MKKRKDTLTMLFLGFALLFTSTNQAAELNWYAKGLQAEYAGDYQRAIDNYIKSANSGVKGANFAIARSYQAIGNERASLEWFIKAANAGDKFAQYETALIYLQGNSATEVDAVNWLTLAAKANHGEAAYELFKIEKNIRWLKIAAEQGVQVAMPSLSDAYKQGLYGAEINLIQAQHWAKRAIDSQE